MSLSPTDSDKKVLRAFADRKPASNNRIESTGDRLNTIGFAGSGCIARWSGDHIIDFGYESGGKFGPALIRALKKYTAPNDWAKKNRGYATMRKNSQYSYKWFGIIRIGGKPKICLANEYKEDAMETRDDLGLPRGLVKIVSRNKVYEMGLKPSPTGPDWARQHEIDALRPPRKNGSRYTARATSGSFWAGQSERFPWRRNPRAPSKYEHEYILQGNYGYGWDDLEFQDKTSFGLRELKQLKKTYEVNQRGAYRIISRKTLKGSVL